MAAVGDVVDGLKVLYSLFQKLHDAPGQLEKAKNATERIKSHLELFDARQRDPNDSYHRAPTKVKQMIENELDCIKKGTRSAKKLLRERRKASALGVIFWIFVRLPLLNQIADDFKESQDQIAMITTTFVLPESIEGVRHEVTTRKHGMFAAANIDFERWTRSNSHIFLRASQNGQTQLTQPLLNSLKEIGIQQNSRLAKLEGILAALQEQQKQEVRPKEAQPILEQPINAFRHVPLNTPARQAESRQPIIKPHGLPIFSQTAGVGRTISQVQRCMDSGSPDTIPNTENKLILIVDSTNGVLSIAAQFYLETIRIWAMNTQHRWLFAYVQSSGNAVWRPPAGANPSPAVLAAAARDTETRMNRFNFVSADEKMVIRQRLAAHESRRLDPVSDLRTYDHILCFDPVSVLSLVSRRRRALQPNNHALAEVHPMPGCEKYVGVGDRGDGPLDTPDAPWSEVSNCVSMALAPFLRKHLHWQGPERLESGPWKTLQFEVPLERAWQLRNMSPDDKATFFQGCLVHVFNMAVSISGPPDKILIAKSVALNLKA
ncbi:hypothetical protein F5B21DRAFT_504951 [Xylaria acuta]|nr:hypothetical protein F5B21DRAFT_504951 [Xylaria acuta]